MVVPASKIEDAGAKRVWDGRVRSLDLGQVGLGRFKKPGLGQS